MSVENPGLQPSSVKKLQIRPGRWVALVESYKGQLEPLGFYKNYGSEKVKWHPKTFSAESAALKAAEKYMEKNGGITIGAASPRGKAVGVLEL